MPELPPHPPTPPPTPHEQVPLFNLSAMRPSSETTKLQPPFLQRIRVPAEASCAVTLPGILFTNLTCA